MKTILGALLVYAVLITLGVSSLWQEYQGYKETAETDLKQINQRIETMEQNQYEIRNICGQVIGEEYFGDYGNDQSTQ